MAAGDFNGDMADIATANCPSNVSVLINDGLARPERDCGSAT